MKTKAAAKSTKAKEKRVAKKVAPLTFETWKLAVQREANRRKPELGDLWSPSDDYELAAIAEDAFRAGQSPRAFFAEAFEEDLARDAYDAHLAEEAAAYEGDEG